jgi:hypothetical protein
MKLSLCLIKYHAMKTDYTHLGFSWTSLVSPDKFLDCITVIYAFQIIILLSSHHSMLYFLVADNTAKKKKSQEP